MRKLNLLLCIIIVTQNLQAQPSDSLLNDSPKDSIAVTILNAVIVSRKKNAVQLLPGKTIINVDSAVSNTGATLLEVLEKSPGISMDRNGNISLKGKQGLTIMIDGKPVQVSGNDLNSLLSGMTAAQVDQIELISSPSAKYDAAGNAGIINIKTKKNRQKGFNGNLNRAIGRGKFTGTVNSLNLNYFAGKINVFANAGINVTRNFTDLYALRTYYQEDNKNIIAFLEQPSYFKGKAPSQTLKTGIDYFLNQQTKSSAAATRRGR